MSYESLVISFLPMPKGRQMPGSGNPTAALAQQCPISNSQCPIKVPHYLLVT
ncbi:MAG: hypothetical protein ACHBN1_20875 [Heteroscytonema crispum UTEX LB 1556]